MTEDLKRISFIVPIGPGEKDHFALLDSLLKIGSYLQVIVVSCRRQDQNLVVNRYENEPTHVICAFTPHQGRACQMNVGADLSKREFLCFLHADSRIDITAIKAMKSQLLLEQDSLYYFDLKFYKESSFLMKINERGANIRSKSFKLPFGDQGYHLHRQLFWKMGGFNEMSSLPEDFDFILRAWQMNIPIVSANESIATSPRRYQKYGWLATTGKHLSYTYWCLFKSYLGRTPCIGELFKASGKL